MKIRYIDIVSFRNTFYSILDIKEPPMILLLIDSSGEYRLLSTQDIAFLQTNGQGELHFYAYDETYRPISLLKEWAMLLQKEGFVQMDRGTIVNTRKIESFDPDLRVVTIPLMDGAVSIPYAEKVRRKLEKELRPGFVSSRGPDQEEESAGVT